LEASVECQLVGRGQLLPAGHAQVSCLRGLAHTHRAVKCRRPFMTTVAEFLFLSGHDARRAMTANDADHRRRARSGQNENGALPRRSVHLHC
jgi:hypothetical protein